MMVVVVEVWTKLYAVKVEVEVELMDDVFKENPLLSAGEHSVMRPVLLPHCCSEEV